MSNYPPGVTGNEFQISGPDSEVDGNVYCPNCGADIETTVTYFRYERWFTCPTCGTETTESDEDQWRYEG